MTSIPAETAADQAEQQVKPPSTRRRKRKTPALSPVVFYATQPGVPTLQQAQEAAKGCLADLIVAWVLTHGEEVSHG